jgi:hypothetical protein
MQNWGIVSLAIILSLAIFPQASLGQIPTLDKLNLDTNQSPQCLDFNQDKICEFIILINGTMVENPDRVEQVTQSKSQAVSSQPVSVQGKCLGLQHNYCRNILLANGTVVANPNFVDTFNPDDYTYGGSTESAPAPQTQTQAQTVEDEEDTGAADEGDEEKTYCDVPNPSNPCHDRKDYSEDTGLYTCMDGSHVADWRACNGNGGEDDEDTSGDEEELPQEGGCQEQDDFCDADEGCRSDSVDCIDDRGFDEDDYNG